MTTPETHIPVAAITVLKDRRRVDPDWVDTLAKLFKSAGQMTAIEVLQDGDGHRLISGAHRLAAAKMAEWETIRAVVKTREEFASVAEITLREIMENLARRELSVLDRAVDIARWREAYNAAHSVSKGGRKAKDTGEEELTAKFAESFTVASQRAFGLSERSITYAIKIASIPASARVRISLHPVSDNQSELLRLASETHERQEKIAELLTEWPPQAKSIDEAIRIIDRLPDPEEQPTWQKVARSFSRMTEADQHRFFKLHEAAIQLWLQGRGPA